jgi:hypothetical protein
MTKALLSKAGISVGIYFMVTAGAVAGWFGADFSAETYQVSAQGQVPVGKMYVSDGRVRTEMTVRGKPMVEIIDSKKGRAWLLDPAMKTYQERSVAVQAERPAKGEPCQADKMTECQLLGEEPINGRPAKKWRFSIGRQQRELWLDSVHHFPVQAAIDGKTVMMMRYLVKEGIGGRQVEKWEAREFSPGGGIVSLQWYDPELNIAIRQQAANGGIRELRNIRLGKQPNDLFVLPADYQLSTPR